MRTVIVEVRDFDSSRQEENQTITSKIEIDEKNLKEIKQDNEQILNRMYEQCVFSIEAKVKSMELEGEG